MLEARADAGVTRCLPRTSNEPLWDRVTGRSDDCASEAFVGRAGARAEAGGRAEAGVLICVSGTPAAGGWIWRVTLGPRKQMPRIVAAGLDAEIDHRPAGPSWV